MPESMTASGGSFVCALPGSHRVGCSAALALFRRQPQSIAACRYPPAGRTLCDMGTKSRETIYGASVRPPRSAQQRRARLPIGSPAKLGTSRMLAFQGPAPPSPPLGDALNAGLSLSRSKMPRLQHASNRRARHRSPAEDHANPRIGAIHALQRLLRGSQLSV